jgi:hypothetical protein
MKGMVGVRVHERKIRMSRKLMRRRQEAGSTGVQSQQQMTWNCYQTRRYLSVWVRIGERISYEWSPLGESITGGRCCVGLAGCDNDGQLYSAPAKY